MTIRFIIFTMLQSLFHKSALVLYCSYNYKSGVFYPNSPRIAQLFKTLLITGSALAPTLPIEMTFWVG